MTLTAAQRFSKQRPCPICDGYDDAARGKGERCYGYLSSDGAYAHCTREDRAGGLSLHPNSNSYAHRLAGDCACGVRHDPRAKATPGRPRKDGARIVATYDYTDAGGALLFQAVRYAPKDFKQRQPDGAGGWLWNLRGVFMVPYRVPELVAAPLGATVFVAEGEKDVDNLRAEGAIATCNPMGAGKWQPQYGAWLLGKHVVVLADNDQAGQGHANDVARSLIAADVAASVKALTLPGLPDKGDVSDWLAAGGTLEQLVALADAAPAWIDPDLPAPPEPRTLDDVHAVFQRWLYMPDTGALDVALAAYVANQGEGNPVWLLVVGAPGFGKTEQIAPIGTLPRAHMLSTLTPASLLSGTARKDRAQGAKGGVLRQIGDFGILIMKDFTSILSMHGDARVEVLGALREIYDGRWTRSVGTDGGQVLDWSGKVGVIGGCTPAIDEHHAVMSQLGERFIFYRMPDFDKDKQLSMAAKAFDLPGSEVEMREEMGRVVRGLFTALGEPSSPVYSAEEKAYLLRVAQFAVIGRAPIIRDSTPSRDISLVPGHEAPTRLTIILRKLFEGMLAIGVRRCAAWGLIRKVALDSMPQLRLGCILALASGEAKSTTVLAIELSYPSKTLHRTLDELHAYQLLARTSQGQGQADLWRLSDWALAAWRGIDQLPVGVNGETDISSDAYTNNNAAIFAGGERGNNNTITRQKNYKSHPSPIHGALPSRVYPLDDTGARDTPEPLAVAGSFAGADGRIWLDFADVPGGWPLERCEPADDGTGR